MSISGLVKVRVADLVSINLITLAARGRLNSEHQTLGREIEIGPAGADRHPDRAGEVHHHLLPRGGPFQPLLFATDLTWLQ